MTEYVGRLLNGDTSSIEDRMLARETRLQAKERKQAAYRREREKYHAAASERGKNAARLRVRFAR